MIACLVRDLFFRAKIEGAGKGVRFLESLEQAGEASLVVVDLEEFPREDIRGFKEKNPGVRVIGYLSHKQVGLREKSLGEGYDLVVARSEFSRRVKELLGRGS